MPISMTKIQSEAPALVSLAKKAQFAVSKHGLDGQTAKVALCLDYSGSAAELYSSGAMQKAAERILATATQFDDDGAIDVFTFDTNAQYLGELNLSNYQGGVDRLVRGRYMGSTDYAAAFRTVVEHYGFTGSTRKGGLFRRSTPAGGDRSVPIYVAFLTDGEPNSQSDAKSALIQASEFPVFFQTVGLGSYGFSFLESLDNMPGRKVDNAGFFTAPDIAAMPDLELLDALLKEFPTYIQSAQAAGVLD